MDIVDYINEVDRSNREYAKSPCPQWNAGRSFVLLNLL